MKFKESHLSKDVIGGASNGGNEKSPARSAPPGEKRVSQNEEEKDKIAAVLVRGLIALFSKMPLSASGHIGDFCGRLAYFLLFKKRRTAYWNIRAALGLRLSETQRKQELLEQFRHLGRNFTEVLTFEKLTNQEINSAVTIHGLERFEKIVAGGKGAVLITGHYGNWELLQVVAGIRGTPIHVLARDQRHPRLNEILMRQREAHGSVAVSRGMNVRFLLKALKEGKLVGVLGDQSAGRSGGILLPFFGRVTTIPTGAFELARRMGADVLPCFMARDAGGKHTIYVEEPLQAEGQDDAEVVQNQAAAYLRLLESHIERSPRQWLWQNKRWKYSWTRRIVVLSDKKPGHFKQTQAAAALFEKTQAYHGRSGLKFETQTVAIEYRSDFAARCLSVFGWLLLPVIRGRFKILNFFLTKDSAQALAGAQADFIFAAGSSMAPVQHLFAAETGAKKIVLMKPPFPYSLLKYDLAVVPAHDEGFIPKSNFRTLISPSGYLSGSFEEEAMQLKSEIKGDERPYAAVFVGGKTHEFDWTVADAEKLLSVLERATSKTGGFMLTTSRRTSVGVERFFKHQMGPTSVCRKLVIANEDSRAFVAKGMLGLAQRMIVTEDSLAMISEAVASGKPVIVIRNTSSRLPEKHRRFLDKLVEKNWITVASLQELSKVITSESVASSIAAVNQEKEALAQALERLL